MGPDAMARQQNEPAPLPDPSNGTTKEREPCPNAIVRLVWKELAKTSPNQLTVGTYTAEALGRLAISSNAMAQQQKEPAPLPDPFNGTTKEREPCRKAVVLLVWKGLAKAAPNQLTVRYVQLELSDSCELALTRWPDNKKSRHHFQNPSMAPQKRGSHAGRPLCGWFGRGGPKQRQIS